MADLLRSTPPGVQAAAAMNQMGVQALSLAIAHAARSTVMSRENTENPIVTKSQSHSLSRPIENDTVRRTLLFLTIHYIPSRSRTGVHTTSGDLRP
jgi:hypothetical protein